jgi:hypothetical protein
MKIIFDDSLGKWNYRAIPSKKNHEVISTCAVGRLS